MRLATVAGFAATAPIRLEAASQARRIPARPIPSTGELMPVIGLGSHDSFQSYPPAGRERPASVIRIFLDTGGRFIDTTLWPNEEEPVLGQLIEEMDVREDLFIANKVIARDRDAGLRQLRDNERIFGKRPIDLMQVWNMLALDIQWPLLREWQEAGKVRYIGITNTRPDTHAWLESFMKKEKPDFMQINYSLLEPQAGERLLPLAQELGIAVVGNRPFINGRYFELVKEKTLPEWAADFDCHSWAQFSLKFILAHPAVTCVITETDKPHHITDNLGAGFGRLPDRKTQQRMLESLVS